MREFPNQAIGRPDGNNPPLGPDGFFMRRILNDE